ncbi:hypothetical protein JW964_13345 [candidate division KSB1 bacterium]|nr:hypothetical protein [candidate division KSB1 bacterium]
MYRKWWENNKVIFQRDGTGTNFGANATIEIDFGLVQLSVDEPKPDYKVIKIETRQNSQAQIDVATDVGPIPVYIHHFNLTGAPASAMSGKSWSLNNIKVSARDADDQLVPKFTSSIYFISSDPAATLPYTKTSPDTFKLTDNGEKTYSGTGFTFKKTGNDTLAVVDVVSGDTSAITEIMIYNTQGYVKIQSSSADPATEIKDKTMVSGDSTLMYAVQYDSYGNLMGLVNVTWSVKGDIGHLGSNLTTVNNKNTVKFYASKAGSGRIEITHATALGDETGVFTVNPNTSAIKEVRICDLPKGVGENWNEKASKTFTTDDILHFYAVGYDAHGNYVKDISTVSWRVENYEGGLITGSGSHLAFNPTKVDVNCEVRATVTGIPGISDIRVQNLVINVGKPASLMTRYRYVEGGITKTAELNDKTLAAGPDGDLAVFVIATDFDKNPIGDIVGANWSLSSGKQCGYFRVDSTDTKGNRYVFRPTKSGVCIIRATSKSDTAIFDESGLVTIIGGDPVALKISTESGRIKPILKDTTITSDAYLVLWALGIDRYGNRVGLASDADWDKDGNLDFLAIDNATSISFNPKKDGTSGHFIVQRKDATWKPDTTKLISVIAGSPHHLRIAQGQLGNTARIPDDTTLVVGQDSLILHAAAFDADDNYSGDINADWYSGKDKATIKKVANYVYYYPKQEGVDQIVVRKDGLIEGYSPFITIQKGQIDSVVIQDAPGPEGKKINTVTMTTDSVLQLFAVGYDLGGDWVGPASVTWKSDSTLNPVINDTIPKSNFNFSPQSIGNGRIFIYHKATENRDTTNTITVFAGQPHGIINLTATPESIPADDSTTTTVKSDEIKDRKGNRVQKGTKITVQSTRGTITTADADTLQPGIQVLVNENGIIEFELKADSGGGEAKVIAAGGTAQGITSVFITNISLSAITSNSSNVSLGQKGIQVWMDVTNLGNDPVKIESVALNFLGSGGENLNDNYHPTPPSPLPILVGGASIRLTFYVEVTAEAKIDTNVTVDGSVFTEISTIRALHANKPHHWAVQNPASFQIIKVQALEEVVSRGDQGLDISVRLKNNSGPNGATAIIENLYPTFKVELTGSNVTSQYVIVPVGELPTQLAAEEDTVVNFKVNVKTGANTGKIIIDGAVAGKDANSFSSILDTQSDTTDSWMVQEAANVSIKKLATSQTTVTRGQTTPWYVEVSMENKGGNPVQLDSCQLQFFRVNEEITSEYQYSYPDTFASGDTVIQDDIEVLNIAVNSTGPKTGIITLRVRAFFSDAGGSGQQLVNQKDTWITVQEPSNVAILNVKPSHPEATQNQQKDWKVLVAMQNLGGSDIDVNTDPLVTHLKFKSNASYVVKPPYFKRTQNIRLKKSETDTLVFAVDSTPNISPGVDSIKAVVQVKESNSAKDTTLTGKTTIKIQESPRIRILQVLNQARNKPEVNRLQPFNLNVVLVNFGKQTNDEVDSVVVRITSNKQVGELGRLVIDNVKPIVDHKLVFPVTAADAPGQNEIFTATILSALSDNTREPITIDPPVSDTTMARIVKPAELEVIKFDIIPDSVQARQYKPYQIILDVRNKGQGSVEFSKPTKDDIVFKVNNVKQTDYQISPPSTLNGKDLYLEGGKRDTLTYTVVGTGGYPGKVDAELMLNPIDRNDPTKTFPVKEQDSVFLKSSAKLRIASIEPVTFMNRDVGQVNKGQKFKVRAVVQNGGAERADRVYVRLKSQHETYVTLKDTLKFIEFIDIEQYAIAEFEVEAKEIADQVEFTAQIDSATGYTSKLPVSIEISFPPKKGFVRIHEPSKLEVTLQGQNGMTAFAMDYEFTMSALVKRTGTSLIDNSGKIKLQLPEGYQLLSPQTVNFSVSEQTSQEIATWKVRSPNSKKDKLKFIASVVSKPVDLYSKQAAIIDSTKSQVFIETVESSLITNVSIIAPDGARDGIISTNQTFQVQASVSYSDNVNNLKSRLDVPEQFKISDTTYVSGNPYVWRWKVVAPGISSNEKELIVNVWGTEKTPDDVTSVQKMVVTTVGRASLDLEINTNVGAIKDNHLQLSAGQKFKFLARVVNNGTANADGSGTISLNLGNSGLKTEDLLQKSYQVDQLITWDLIAPNVATSAQPITIKLESVPNDENSQDAPEVTNRNRRVFVETLNQGDVSVANIQISQPIGAKDGIVSTNQLFQVSANVSWIRCQDIQAEVVFPAAFFSCDAPIQEPQNSTNNSGENEQVNFWVKALSNSTQNQKIKIYVRGKDANDPEKVLIDSTEVLNIRIATNAEARIQVRTETKDNIVTVGQRFRVKAWLSNRGESSLQGFFTAEIYKESPEYTVVSPIQQTVAYNDTIVWLVDAPDFPLTGKAIRVTVENWPQDENTNEIPFSTFGEKEISVTTEEKNVILATVPNLTPLSITKGAKNVTMMGLIIRSSGSSSSNKLLFKGARIKLKDRKGEIIPNPSEVITRIAAVPAHQRQMILGEINPVTPETELRLNFTRIDTVYPEIIRPDTINFVVDISPDIMITSFNLAIDTTSALIIEDQYSGLPPKYINPNGTLLQNLNLTSNFTAVLEANFKATFLNYPNPFGSRGKDRTKFIYYLEQESDVEINIFTVLGELVWSKKFSQHDPEGAAGMHEENNLSSGGPPIWWDGRNGNGNKVLNGVYIAVLSTGDGKQTTTKVAVLK